MSQIKDLEILEKYLSQEELKEVAKEVASNYFSSSLSKNNPYAKTNLEFYIGQGALQAVLEYGDKLDFDFHSQELKERVSKLIKNLSVYNLPNTYVDIAKEYIESNKNIIHEKIDSLMSDFVNKDDYNTAYRTFSDYIGEMFADLLDNLLKEKYSKDK